MKPLVISDSIGTGQLPFLEQAKLSGIAIEDEYYEVLEVVETRKRTGFLIKTKTFQVFLYKSSGLLQALEAALELCVEDNPGDSLWLQLENTSVEGITLFFNEDEPRIWVKSKKLNVLIAYKATHFVSTELEQPTIIRKKK